MCPFVFVSNSYGVPTKDMSSEGTFMSIVTHPQVFAMETQMLQDCHLFPRVHIL